MQLQHNIHGQMQRLFKKFCDNADIKCEEIPVSKYFNKNMCDGAFLTEEYTYDAMQLKKVFLDELKKIFSVSTDILQYKYCFNKQGKMIFML